MHSSTGTSAVTFIKTEPETLLKFAFTRKKRL